MTRIEVIRLAKQAGFNAEDYYAIESMLLKFAELIAQSEREECAALCEAFQTKAIEAQSGPTDELANVMLRQVADLGHGECARAIRARSTT